MSSAFTRTASRLTLMLNLGEPANPRAQFPVWSTPHCWSGGLARGCEFDSSSGVKLADERNKQSGATAAPAERICRSCQNSPLLYEPRAEPGLDRFSRDIYGRERI